MDLSRLLACLAVVASALLLAGCQAAVAERASPLPTVAETALPPFVSTLAPPTPTPAPTLPTSTPWPTATATATPAPAATATPEATASPTADPAQQINGVPFSAIAVIPPEVADNVRQIAARGQELGRNPNAFSKLGDSGVLIESNLTRFDNGPYTLGPYEFLQPTITHFAGSWARYGVGARVALTTIGTFDPQWANAEWCQPGEHLLACEIRLHNPAVLLIRLGTNDGSADLYERYMGQIIQYTIDNGVIPVLGTKADRFEGDDSINSATRRLATAYRVPLWDFDTVAGTLPNRGLTDDHAHLTVYGHDDYNDPETLQRGYPASDLSTLVVLDAIRRIAFTTP